MTAADVCNTHVQQTCATVAARDSILLIAQVRPFNLAEFKVIRDLNPDDMNKLISVSGMVSRSSSIIPDPRCEL